MSREYMHVGEDNHVTPERRVRLHDKSTPFWRELLEGTFEKGAFAEGVAEQTRNVSRGNLSTNNSHSMLLVIYSTLVVIRTR